LNRIRSRKKAFEQSRAREEDSRRVVHDIFQFWRRCPEPPCRRAHACVGNQPACFDRHWPLVPETAKVGFRAFIAALAAGQPAEEALQAAQSAEARYEAGFPPPDGGA
jgi:hypothetical protein